MPAVARAEANGIVPKKQGVNAKPDDGAFGSRGPLPPSGTPGPGPLSDSSLEALWPLTLEAWKEGVPPLPPGGWL